MTEGKAMDFGDAIRALKAGLKVAREGWNGKGMYLWLLPAAKVKAEWCKEQHLHELVEANGGEIECLDSIRMLTADRKILTGWLASQSDMLSEDWKIVEPADEYDEHTSAYTTCDFCGRQMHHNGCVKHWYIINNEDYEALKQGEDGNEGVCHDCGAKPGEYHHPGCDMEKCPVCHTQLITCSCGKETRKDNQTMAGQSVIREMLDAGVSPRDIIEMAYEAKGKPVPGIDFNGLSHGQLMDMIEELAEEEATGNIEESP